MTSTSVSREKVKEIAEILIVNVAEATAILGCTRQYIFHLMKTGRLVPIKNTGKENLYFRPDVESFKKNKRHGAIRKLSV